MASALTKKINKLVDNTRKETVTELKKFLVDKEPERKDDIEALCEKFNTMTTKPVKPKRPPTAWNLHVKETREQLAEMGVPKDELFVRASKEASKTWKLKKAELEKKEDEG